MKRRLIQRIFDRNVRGNSSNARRLSLEALENRELLNADWGGFSSEILNEFVADSAKYSVDLSENTADLCALEDFNGDGVDELATINYSSKTLSVYQRDDAGVFSLVGSTKVAELDGSGYCAAVFGDVDANGVADLVVVSQDANSLSLSLTATVYSGASTFGFTKTSSKALDVSKFEAGLLFQTLDAALLPNASGGCDLAVQGSAVAATGTTPRQTILYSGLGTDDFGTTSRATDLSGFAATDDPVLVGSGTFGGKELLISIDRTSSSTQKSNCVVLSECGSSVANYRFDLTSVGTAFVAEWALEQDGVLVVGGTKNGVSGVLSMKINSLTDGTFAYQWLPCSGLTINAASCAAIGNIGGSQTTPELFVANGKGYVVFEGVASATSGFEFQEASAVVTTPNYRATHIGDYDVDGEKEALLVGDSNIWVAVVDAAGTIGAPTSLYAFDRAVKDAVFGDFNGDGRLDVVVYYQSEGSSVTVGTNLQLFQQTSTGDFVPVASYGIMNSFVDFAVGSFTQTEKDEIAVLYQTAKGVQFINVLQLSVAAGSTTLVGARTFQVGSAGAASIAVGSIFGTGVDDLVLVCPNKDAISVLKNSGKTFVATSYSTNTGLSNVSNFNPTSARVGDVDGDGANDIVVLNSAAGSNRGHLAYLLQTATGFAPAASNASLYVEGDAPQGLELADLNGDGRLDAVTIQRATSGKAYLYAFLNDASTVFAAGVRSAETTVVGNSPVDLTLAFIDDDSAIDVALAQGKKIGAYANASAGPASSGSVRYVVQSASAAAGASFEAAAATARTWLDEWSNFYVDVWASTDGTAALSSVVAAFQYNSAYFDVVGVEAAAGFNVDYVADDNVVSATVSAKSGTNATGTTLVARVRFAPVAKDFGGVEYVAGGVAIPADGAIADVGTGFGAALAAQKVNGAPAATVATPQTKLYPVCWDFNDDGTVNVVDFNSYMTYFDYETSAIPENDARYRVFDSNGDGKINVIDFNNFISYYDVKATKTADSFYRSEPGVAISSAVVESTVALGGDEFALVDPSEQIAERREKEAAAVDVAVNAWDVDSDAIAEFAAAVVESSAVVDDAESNAFADWADVDFGAENGEDFELEIEFADEI